MTARPRLLVLNATCLDVVDAHREWIRNRGVDLVAEQGFRNASPEAAFRLLQDVDAVILPAPGARGIGAWLPRLPRLRVCSIAASGYDWLDIEAATANGVVATYTTGGRGTEAVADLAWGLLISVARQIPFHDRSVCEGRNERRIGAPVYGQTLGIVGLGHIGKAMARRARGFNMRVLASARTPDAAFLRECPVEIVPVDQLVAESDFVSLHLRLDATTRGLFGAEMLARMKPGAFLINTARRELVDEPALAAAILGGRIAGAALDEAPGPDARALLGLPNVIFTAHLGNRERNGVNEVFQSAVENALAVLGGTRPQHVVNPAVYSGRLRGAAPGLFHARQEAGTGEAPSS